MEYITGIVRVCLVVNEVVAIDILRSSCFERFFSKNIILLVTLATVVNRINSTLSNTPTTYFHNVDKERYRCSALSLC